MRITNLGLAYSIEKVVERDVEIPSIIKYDGITLPTDKPYLLIEEFPTTQVQLSKGRETITTTSRFRIGIVAKTYFDLSEYSEKVDDLFTFDTEIQYYTSSGISTDYTFSILPGYIKSPEFSDDKSKDIDKHRVFYDVEIQYNKHKNTRGNY